MTMNPGVITMKRAIKNLKFAITQNNWVANAYKFEDLYSTIFHIDSLEHYKVTKDPRNLFVLKEKKSHINPILDKNSLEEVSNQDVNSVFEPTLWRLENHAASMVVQLINRDQRTHNPNTQRTLTTKFFKKSCILCGGTSHENNTCPAAGSITYVVGSVKPTSNTPTRPLTMPYMPSPGTGRSRLTPAPI